MAPPVEAFPPSQLEERVNWTEKGKWRKPPVKLEECKLLEMFQYYCDVPPGSRKNPRGVVKCVPVERLFRRCANGLTVETTSWEGVGATGMKVTYTYR